MSTADTTPQLSLAGKLGISVALTKALLSALTRLVTSPFKGSKGAPTYFRDVAFALARTQLRNMSIAQAQYISKSSTEVYLDFCKANNIAPQSVDLGNGAQGHWIGEQNAKVVLLYLHGGGYAQGMTPAHVTFFHGIISELNKAGASISIVFLAYTLAPQAHHPTQLIQATSLLNHLLQQQSRPASSIILGGDSAGGNLALGLLSHLLHPHPQVPSVDLHGEKLRGALLISPWVSFATHHPSYTRNAESDMFDAVPLNNWSSAFLGPSNLRQNILMGDSYSEPLLAEPSWWSGSHAVLDEVLIWGGGGEIFIDGINAFAEKFREGWVSGGGSAGAVSVVEREGLCHEAMVVDLILGYKEKGPGARDVEGFIRSKL